MGENYHLIRISKLKKLGVPYEEIISKIFYEYGIKLTVSEIINLENFDSKEGLESEKSKTEMILSVCKSQKVSLSSIEISSEIENIFGFYIHKSEVNRLIHKNLRGKIKYDRLTFKYFINEISNSEINKVISGIEKELTKKTYNLLRYSVNYSLLGIVKEYFRLKYIQVNTGNQKIDYLIKTVVKDNIITDCEEEFLRLKASELKYDNDIIEKAKLNLESNNPYLDDIIHIIFNDGKITSNELEFLKEKTKENHFSEKFVCERFWIIGISEYSSHLLKIKDFQSLMICLFAIIRLNREDLIEKLFINELNVLKNKNIESIIQMSFIKLNGIVNELLSDAFDFQFDYTRKILFENYKSFDNEESKYDVITTNFDENSFDRFIKILNQEKLRIGTPDVNLLVENIKYRIENKLWD
jgi:hypothetical protein